MGAQTHTEARVTGTNPVLIWLTRFVPHTGNEWCVEGGGYFILRQWKSLENKVLHQEELFKGSVCEHKCSGSVLLWKIHRFTCPFWESAVAFFSSDTITSTTTTRCPGPRVQDLPIALENSAETLHITEDLPLQREIWLSVHMVYFYYVCVRACTRRHTHARTHSESHRN